MLRILTQKHIESLFHFTQANNLPNILSYGLLPRMELIRRGIESNMNDEYRYDDCTDANCLSIEFPNYKMFYGLRQNGDSDWIVLEFDSKILCDFECAFCQTNAGDLTMFSTSIDNRKGRQALLRLFDDWPGGPDREELSIPDCYPTNPQAEVLVFNTIPIEYLETIYFEDNRVLNAYEQFIPESIDFYQSDRYFKYRKDWMYWQKR